MDRFPPISPSVDGAGDPGQATGPGRGRDSLFLMARFRRAGTVDEPLAVRVRNLSEGGLMAELDVAPPIDSAVEVEVRGLGWIAGRIAWHTAGRAGIAFDEPVDPRRARKPVGNGTRTPAHAKPILAAPRRTPPRPR